MADNTQTDLATTAGDLIADEDIAGVKYQRVKLIDATVGSTSPVGTAANPLHVTSAAAASAGLTDTELRASALPVSGAFYPATQPVSVSGTVPVSGAFYQATQPVSLAAVPSHPVTNTGAFAVQVTSAPSTPVTGTFYQATQPVSLAAQPLPAGASTEATLSALKGVADSLLTAAQAIQTAAAALNTKTTAVNTGAIAGTVAVSNFPVGGTGLTDDELRATSVPVTVSNFPVGGTGLTDTALRTTPLDTQPSIFSFLERVALRAMAKLTFTLTGARVDCGGSSVAVSSLPTLAAVTTVTTLSTLSGIGYNTQNGQAIQQSQLAVACGFRRNIT